MWTPATSRIQLQCIPWKSPMIQQCAGMWGINPALQLACCCFACDPMEEESLWTLTSGLHLTEHRNHCMALPTLHNRAESRSQWAPLAAAGLSIDSSQREPFTWEDWKGEELWEGYQAEDASWLFVTGVWWSRIKICLNWTCGLANNNFVTTEDLKYRKSNILQQL